MRDLEQWRGRQPVLVDDIISSGRAMEVAIDHLIEQGFAAPVIIGVHGLFADDAFERLRAAGAGQIVSTNAVPHVSNAIDLSDLNQGAARQFTEGNEVSLDIRGRNR